jgi:hypothetical protein
MVKRVLFTFFILILLILTFTTGCGTPVSPGKVIFIAGAWDIISPFQRKILPTYNSQTTLALQTLFSSNPISQVREGKIDIAVLGRDPTADEVIGLKDCMIAYDAVCMIIDSNSYNGGQYSQNGIPIKKASGFKNISTTELKNIMNNYLTPFGLRWFWGDGYYVWKPAFDEVTGSYTNDNEWVAGEIALFPSLNMVPEKYDTQTLLYKVLGLNENTLARAISNKFSSVKMNAEEEVLSVEYYNGPPYIAGSGDFTYKIGFVSRRVIPVALQHIPISVVSIDGIDPIQNTQAIYNGTYLLSRKIHVITSADCSTTVMNFIDFLLSQSGQQLLINTGYLPLP